ncbi:MAG: hypothetical protein JW915_15405 [Chitinispirillaceae bacterium]|nr:hypothetical protein [Chitinispirillaceae bacterium]
MTIFSFRIKIFIILMLFAILAIPLIAAAQEQVFEVLSIEGSVKVQRSNKRIWEKVQIGEKLKDNDLVETFFQTKLLMRFGEKNLIILGSNSKALLNIVEAEKKSASNVNLTLFSGGLFAKAIENCHISIYTANAVGEIDTGSLSAVADSKSGETGFQLLGGTAFVRNISQQNGKTLRSGLTTMILPNKEPTAPLYITHRHVAVLKHFFGSDYIEMELDTYGIKPTEEQGDRTSFSHSFSTKGAEYSDEGMHKQLFSLEKIFGRIIDDKILNSAFYRPIAPPSDLFSNKGTLSFLTSYAFTGEGVRQKHTLTAKRNFGFLDAGIRLSAGQNSKSAMQAGFNSLQGILDKIDHLTIGKMHDSLYLRVGSIDNMTFGCGLLVDNYSNKNINSLYNPLGVSGQLQLSNDLELKLFLNEIVKPVTGGIYLGLNPSVYHLGFSYVFDTDQYSNTTPENAFRFSTQMANSISIPNKKLKPSSVHAYNIDFGVEIFTDDFFTFNLYASFAQKLLNGNDGYTFKMPCFDFSYEKFSAGGCFLIQQGRLLSNLFNSRYHSNRYRIKNGESSFFPDTIITLTNAYSKNRYTVGFELFFKINPYKGVDIQFEWQQDISNRYSILFPTDTIKGRDAPGDFSLKLSGRINEKIVKYLRYGEIFLIQNHGTLLPYSGTFFKSWDFESGLYALSKPLFLNLAFELGASVFYFDQGSRLDNEVTGTDLIFELSAGVRWGFL